MAASGLTGKKFVGKIVEGQDPKQRGRYYVHIPEIQPHIAESKGILCCNAVHSTRVANGNRGSYGSYMPLHVGTQVEVEFPTDDISSARVVAIVSDYHEKSDMGAGKLISAEPTGKTVSVALDGLPNSVPFGIAELINSKINTLINTGTEIGKQILSQLGNKLTGIIQQIGGDIAQKVMESMTKVSEAVSEAVKKLENATKACLQMAKVVNIVKDQTGIVDSAKGAFDNNQSVGTKAPGACAPSVTEQKEGCVGDTNSVISKVMSPEKTPLSDGTIPADEFKPKTFDELLKEEKIDLNSLKAS